MLKNLKDITWKEFVTSRVADINTWPYLPLGTLSQPKESVSRPSTEELMRFHSEEWKEIDRFAELFSEKQKVVLGWIITALIGIFGNLAVNLGFALPILAGNLHWMFLSLFIVAILIVMYLLFLPKVSMVLRFIPSYESFPHGYETYVKNAPCSKLHSQLIFSFRNLDEKVADFGSAVRLAILKDCLRDPLEKASYVHISCITKIDEFLPACFIEVSTNGIKPWLDPRGREKIRNQLRNLVQAMLYARMHCSVRSFELDQKEWDIHGCDFIDGVSAWDFKEVRNAIIDQLKRERIRREG